MFVVLLATLVAASPLDRTPPAATAAQPLPSVSGWHPPPRTTSTRPKRAVRAWRPQAPPPPGRAMKLNCPRAYVSVAADLLPSGWRADPGHVEAKLIGARVRGSWLRCEYRGGGDGAHVNVERAVPYGYTCRVTDGTTFRCARAGRRK